jgi:hypothetical protein
VLLLGSLARALHAVASPGRTFLAT